MVACLIVFMLVVNRIGAQSQTVTIPETSAATRQQDSMAIKQMFKRYEILEERVDRVRGRELLYEIIKKGKESNILKAVSVATNYLAMDLMETGEYRKSIAVQLEGLNYAKDPANVNYVNIIYRNLGQAYESLGKYDTALIYFYKALDTLKGNAIRRRYGADSASVYNAIGIVWSKVGEATNSLNTFKLVEEMTTKNGDTEMLGMVTMNIGQIYFGFDSLDLAEKYFSRSVALSCESNLHLSLAMYSLAQIADKKKNHELALKYLFQALEMSKKSKRIASHELAIMAAIGKVYVHMGNYEKARPIIISAYQRASVLHQPDVLKGLEHDLARMLSEAGSHKDAYHYLLRSTEYEDSLHQIEKAKSLNIWMAAQTAEKDKAMMVQRLHIARQESQLQQKNILIGGTLLGALLLVSFSLPLLRNYKYRQLIHQSLIRQMEHTQEINQLKAQVRGEEQERIRIAQELHDGIASQLLDINLHIERLKNKDEDGGTHRKSIASVFRRLTDVTQDVRKTAHSLMPDLLLEEGLATAVASICTKAGRNNNLSVDFQEYGVLPVMDKDIELSIYRMVQELIQNVVKNTMGATTMLVQLSAVGTLLSITVEDNGDTFTEGMNHAGLQQIKSRAVALKGHFDLQSIKGRGTTAYLEFDLQRLL